MMATVNRIKGKKIAKIIALSRAFNAEDIFFALLTRSRGGTILRS